MHGRVVKRRCAAVDAQEASALRERGRAEARHFEELAATCEAAVLVAPGDDVLCRGRCDARDVREQGRARRVEIDADMVDGGLDDGIEGANELLLVDVVLVLADADGLRVDLDELGQRVLHAARDGDSTADRHVVLGQLFFREL